ncbi:MAG: glycoside hydrolase family 19 protein [Hyphomicrobiales bacterium]|nr:glycoside hydrolase family 19 protein [Hyphomicrobiales bacterium]
MITADMLDRRWPRATHSLVDAIVASAPAVFAKFEITTPLRLVHFLAHASVECAAGTALEENLNYSAERLHAVWPARFPSIGSAQPYAHNPRLLADKVYDGRMGNRAGTDDGWNYRGRGLIDVTGAAMYERIGEATGLDLKANPGLASAPDSALEVAAALWMLSKANQFADRDAIRAETKVINGGLTGLADREAWLRAWKRELAL